MRTARRGERLGWTWGWIGGFIWVAVLSLVFLVQRKVGPGLVGVLLTGAAVGIVLFVAPWRYPKTPYWKLMLGPYGMFFLAIAWAVWAFGGHESLDLNGWNLLWLIPALSPFGLLSNKRWEDSSGSPKEPPDRPSLQD